MSMAPLLLLLLHLCIIKKLKLPRILLLFLLFNSVLFS